MAAFVHSTAVIPRLNLLSCLSVPVAIITVMIMIMIVMVLMAPFPITPLLVLI